MDLADLGLRDLAGIGTGSSSAFSVHLEHDGRRFSWGFVKDRFENVHDEFHRRVVVIVQKHFVVFKY